MRLTCSSTTIDLKEELLCLYVDLLNAPFSNHIEYTGLLLVQILIHYPYHWRIDCREFSLIRGNMSGLFAWPLVTNLQLAAKSAKHTSSTSGVSSLASYFSLKDVIHTYVQSGIVLSRHERGRPILTRFSSVGMITTLREHFMLMPHARVTHSWALISLLWVRLHDCPHFITLIYKQSSLPQPSLLS